MTGKYTSRAKYLAARAKWGVVRGLLASMSRWEPIRKPAEGYSIVIGCPAKLLTILGANLALLYRQDLSGCREVVCVVDAPREAVEGERLEREMAGRFGAEGAGLRWMYYTPREYRVLDRLGYPAGFCWYSWQKGLGTLATRHALLHDFDAFPLRPGLLRERYESVLQDGAAWLGQRCYQGNGVEREDGLVTTFEMVLDIAAVRERLRPIELFNRITTYRGRTVEFDITLEAQASGQLGAARAMDIAEEEMVHPSQVVHQFTELTHNRDYVPPARNRLPFIPYLLDVAGDERVLADAVRKLATDATFELGGRTVQLGRTDPEHVVWLAKQAGLMEAALHGRVRDHVSAYFEAVQQAIRLSRERGDAAVSGGFAATSSRERQTSCTVPAARGAT